MVRQCSYHDSSLHPNAEEETIQRLK
jgi:hypothetical protein